MNNGEYRGKKNRTGASTWSVERTTRLPIRRVMQQIVFRSLIQQAGRPSRSPSDCVPRKRGMYAGTSPVIPSVPAVSLTRLLAVVRLALPPGPFPRSPCERVYLSPGGARVCLEHRKPCPFFYPLYGLGRHRPNHHRVPSAAFGHVPFAQPQVKVYHGRKIYQVGIKIFFH